MLMRTLILIQLPAQTASDIVRAGINTHLRAQVMSGIILKLTSWSSVAYGLLWHCYQAMCSYMDKAFSRTLPTLT